MSLSTIRDILIADATIISYVGENVFVDYADQEVQAPYILLEEVFKDPNDCKQEGSVMDNYGFAVTAVAPTFKVVDTLLSRVRVLLKGYKDSYFRGVFFVGIEKIYDGTQGYSVNSNTYKSLITAP